MVPTETTSDDESTLTPGDLSGGELAAWRGMLRVTHRLRQQLAVDLTERWDLSMADYDALVALAAQPGRSMRMAALAEEILQPKSSVTRIIDSLASRDLVRRESTTNDGRGATAVLTGKGRRTFTKAHRSHITNVRRLFLNRLDAEQVDVLANVWSRFDESR